MGDQNKSPLFLGVNETVDVYTDSSESNKKKAYAKVDALLRRWVTSENTIVLAGAGTSMGDEGSGGKSMAGLWESVKKKIGDKAFNQVLELVSFPKDSNDLEELISRLILKRYNAA